MLFQYFWFFYFLHTTFSIEEPVREKNLEPRHFNPHPYQNGVRRRTRIGPVVFPYDDENGRDVNTNFVRPTEEVHPYQKVAKKHRKRKFGRYEAQDEKINPQLEQALAKHGAKVLKLAPEKLAKDHVPFTRDIHKRHNYAFSYKVLDHSSGDDFSHSQVQDSSATNGEYRVKLPDGRLQIVSYTADHNGYKADVKYTKSEDHQHEPEKIYRDPLYQIEQIPVRQLHPVKTNTNQQHQQQQIDYYDDVHPVNQPIVKLKTVVPNAEKHGYDGYASYDSDYGSIVVTPSPGYSNGAVSANANFQLPLPLNVQIYTTNARDYMVGNYIPFASSTQRSYHSKDVHHYRHNLISPQIINNGDHGLVLPLSTPSSFVLTDQHGQVIDNINLVSSTAVPFVVSTTPAPGGYGSIHSTVAPHIRYK